MTLQARAADTLEETAPGVTSGSVPPPAADQQRRAPPPADERELLRRVQLGEAAAVDELVRRYIRRAFAVAYRLLGHREDAEDLVQDAFVSALEHIGTFDLTRPFGPWFFRIVVNRGLNLRSARAVRRTDLLADDMHTSGPSPHEELERSEVRTRFRAAVTALPRRQRLAVELFDIEGFTSVEIGKALGIPSGTVRWYVHEARRALRQALKPLSRERRGNDEP
jgi:RNA polymerase sigma-70 factor (ECF subfamily)